MHGGPLPRRSKGKSECPQARSLCSRGNCATAGDFGTAARHEKPCRRGGGRPSKRHSPPRLLPNGHIARISTCETIGDAGGYLDRADASASRPYASLGIDQQCETDVAVYTGARPRAHLRAIKTPISTGASGIWIAARFQPYNLIGNAHEKFFPQSSGFILCRAVRRRNGRR